MSVEAALAEVEYRAQALEAAGTALRQAVTDAVATDGVRKSHVAIAAKITRQTLDRWLAESPVPVKRHVSVLTALADACSALTPYLPAERAGWVLNRIGTDKPDVAIRTLEFALKAAPPTTMGSMPKSDRDVVSLGLLVSGEAKRLHEAGGFWAEIVHL